MNIFIKGLLIAAITTLFDQWSKFYVFQILNTLEQPVIEIMPSLNLVKVYNYGVSFGMFNDLENGRLILSFIALSITIALCVWLYRVTETYMCVALGLIIGGAIGNIIDRLRFGAVADFIDVYVGNYHWPAFNIADSAVCIGVFIILFDGFFSKENKGQQDAKILSKAFIIITFLPFLAACSGNIRDNLGMRRSAPNEFKVVSNPMLSVPPEFSLRPPIKEDEYVEPRSVTKDAKNILFEQASAEMTVADSITEAEHLFSNKFGASDGNPEIKSLLTQDELKAKKLDAEKGLLDKLKGLTLQDEEAESPPVVNAQLEKDRIVDNKRKGESVTDGETPTVESSDKKGWLNRIFFSK